MTLHSLFVYHPSPERRVTPRRSLSVILSAISACSLDTIITSFEEPMPSRTLSRAVEKHQRDAKEKRIPHPVFKTPEQRRTMALSIKRISFPVDKNGKRR